MGEEHPIHPPVKPLRLTVQVVVAEEDPVKYPEKLTWVKHCTSIATVYFPLRKMNCSGVKIQRAARPAPEVDFETCRLRNLRHQLRGEMFFLVVETSFVGMKTISGKALVLAQDEKGGNSNKSTCSNLLMLEMSTICLTDFGSLKRE